MSDKTKTSEEKVIFTFEMWLHHMKTENSNNLNQRFAGAVPINQPQMPQMHFSGQLLFPFPPNSQTFYRPALFQPRATAHHNALSNNNANPITKSWNFR